jgi:hypothetical protein
VPFSELLGTDRLDPDGVVPEARPLHRPEAAAAREGVAAPSAAAFMTAPDVGGGAAQLR